MPEVPTDLSKPPGDFTNAIRPGRNRWQVGLLTLCLLVVTVAVWTAFVVNRRQNALLEAKIAVMRPLARELAIDDPGQIAIVKLEALWMGENQWDLYLPDGKYRLCLATHEIGMTGLPPIVKSSPLEAGRHQIALEQKKDSAGCQVTVRWDGTGQFSTREPKEWDTGESSTTEGGYTTSTQMPTNKPAILLRTWFMTPEQRSVPPTSPSDGILLWIERADH